MANAKLIHDYTSGSIPKQLARFMLPFMASNALQLVYSLVDMVIVGRFVGSAGLSAVSQGSAIVLFFSLFCMGFSNSGQIMIAQFVGANRRDQLKPLIGTLFSVMAIGGAALTVLALALRGTLLRMMSVPPEAWDMARAYVTICGGGLLFTVGFNAVSAILRGMGDSRHPFIFLALSSVLNLILDYILTGLLGLGVAGAAFATVFSGSAEAQLNILFKLFILVVEVVKRCVELVGESVYAPAELADFIPAVVIALAVEIQRRHIFGDIIHFFNGLDEP